MLWPTGQREHFRAKSVPFCFSEFEGDISHLGVCQPASMSACLRVRFSIRLWPAKNSERGSPPSTHSCLFSRVFEGIEVSQWLLLQQRGPQREVNTRGDPPVRERNRHAVVGDLVQKHALLAVGLLASLCGALGGASHLRERVGHERSTENQGPSFMAEVLPYGPTRWLPCFSKSAR